MNPNKKPHRSAPGGLIQRNSDVIIELISTVKLSKDGNLTDRINATSIYFIVKGNCTLHSGKSKMVNLLQGNAIVLPITTIIRIEANTDVEIAVFTLDHRVKGEIIPSPKTRSEKSLRTLSVLEMNEKVWIFLTNTLSFIKDGLSSPGYHQMKLEELFLILEAYYPEQVLSRFLSPLFSRNAVFERLVYDNWTKTDELEDLAAQSGLSLSGFSKRFKKVFGTAPYQWIMDRKSHLILEELQTGNKSIKQLTGEYGFYSVQHFGYYCKKRFGLPPGKIRKQGKIEIKGQ
ncbi:MAG: helix-turn-helix transcriptional regulator [Alistipes sp.]|nr:helix-turn-helix transcriptional regulator [Alistipes sp.]